MGQGQKSKVFYFPTRFEIMNCVYRTSERGASGKPTSARSLFNPPLTPRKQACAPVSQRCPGVSTRSRSSRAKGYHKMHRLCVRAQGCQVWKSAIDSPLHAARVTKPALRTERESALLGKRFPLILAATGSQTAVSRLEVTGVIESTSTDTKEFTRCTLAGPIPLFSFPPQNPSVCNAVQQWDS